LIDPTHILIDSLVLDGELVDPVERISWHIMIEKGIKQLQEGAQIAIRKEWVHNFDNSTAEVRQ
jgi:hypothetical protein